VADTLTGNESLHLPEFGAPPADPIGLLDRWLGIAAEHGLREPLAVALATVDARGHPASQQLLNRRDPHTTIRARGHHAGCGLSERSWLWHMPGAVAVKKVYQKTPSGWVVATAA